SGWLTTGPRVQRFEQAVKDYVGCRHAIALNSCTGALHLSLAALGVGPGDEVITSPVTWPSTANVIVWLGAKPVFIDIEPDTLNIDPSHIEEKITSRTKAIIPVHMAGLPCNLEAIHRIASSHGIPVVEDAAHAIGATYQGKNIGTLSPLTCFSFYPIKNITTIEGGLVATEDDEMADHIRRLSLHGISKDAWKRYSATASPHWEVLEPGYKYNMTDVQAAIGIHQIKKLDRFLEIRRQYAAIYREALQDVEEISLPTAGNEQVSNHAWHLFIVRLALDKVSITRDELLDALKRENVGTGIHFRSLHLQHYYRNTYSYQPKDFPHAARISDQIISIPLYPKMEEKDVMGVVRSLKKLLRYYAKMRQIKVPRMEMVMDSYSVPVAGD
ncbi:MAG: DegT/DnrJ/EryC1/StrS family aminotransferase, partial [Dehalococcoidia bacterium]